MKINKKLLLSLGTLSTIVAPVAAIVSCDSQGAVKHNSGTAKQTIGNPLSLQNSFTGTFSSEKAKIDFMNLGTDVPTDLFKVPEPGITSITLPSVTSVDDGAFKNFQFLTSLVLPKAKKIGNSAVQFSNDLNTLVIPEATLIGDNAFQHSSKLTSLIANKAEIIGTSAFETAKLTTLSIHSAMKIGDNAFKNSELTSTLKLPEVITIGDGAFWGSKFTGTLNLPKATIIGAASFMHSKFASLKAPLASVIGPLAFKHVPLTSITIPQSLSIGDNAFTDSNQEVRDTVAKATKIDPVAEAKAKADAATAIAEGIKAKAQVAADVAAAQAKAKADAAQAKADYEAEQAKVDSSQKAAAKLAAYQATQAQKIDAELAYQNSVKNSTKNTFTGKFSTPEKQAAFEAITTTVPDHLFWSEPGLTSISLPKVKTIGDNAFSSSPLIHLNLPEVTSIGEGAFTSSLLTSLSLPKVETLGLRSFRNSHLISLSLPELTSISTGVFWNLQELSTLNLPKVKTIGENVFYSCHKLTTLDLPEVKSVGNEAFCNVPLIHFTAPKLTTIGYFAFDTAKLTSLSLPEVATIGDNAFMSSPLIHLNLPKVTSIGKYAFYNSSLIKVDVPKTATLGDKAFFLANKFHNVILKTTKDIKEWVNAGKPLDDVTITLPKGDNSIDFTVLGANIFRTIFKDMDMSNVVLADKQYSIAQATFNHVTNLQKFIDHKLLCDDIKLINIDEDIDFSKVYSYDMTFKDMDMSHVKTLNGNSSFDRAKFINVKNLNLIGKEFSEATFTNVNGKTGSDCSGIPGHPDFIGDINKYKRTITSVDELKEFIRQGISLARAIITLPNDDNTIDFSTLGVSSYRAGLDMTTFKDMDMSNIIVEYISNPLSYATFDHVTGIQNFLKNNKWIGDFQFATFTHIDELIDFSDLDIFINDTNFKDMDMSYIITPEVARANAELAFQNAAKNSTKNTFTGKFSTPEKQAAFEAITTIVPKDLFKNEPGLTSVSLPNVTSIGSDAFEDSPLIHLYLPNVTSIGGGAFTSSLLTSLSLPKVKTLGSDTFNRSLLTHLSLPEVKSIGDRAFAYSKLKTLNLPKVETIGMEAFHFSLITSISIPKSVAIGPYAFSLMYSLWFSNEQVKDTITKAAAQAELEQAQKDADAKAAREQAQKEADARQAEADRIQAQKEADARAQAQKDAQDKLFPEIAKIRADADKVAKQIQTITSNFVMPKITSTQPTHAGGTGTLTIAPFTEQKDAHVFYELDNVHSSTGLIKINPAGETINIPDNSEVIIYLKTGINDNSPYYSRAIKKRITFASDETPAMLQAQSQARSLAEAELKRIEEQAELDAQAQIKTASHVSTKNTFTGTFSSPEKQAEFEAITTTVPAKLFENETGLTSISLPNVISIGDEAFSHSHLTHLDLPKVITIGYLSFGASTYLKSLDLPKVKTIGESAFVSSTITHLSLPEVLSIGGHAFVWADLSTLDLPKVKIIGEAAFSESERLTTLSFPNVEAIGDWAFAGAGFRGTGITSLDLPKVKFIGRDVFRHSPLTHVSIPDATVIVKNVEPFDFGQNIQWGVIRKS